MLIGLLVALGNDTGHAFIIFAVPDITDTGAGGDLVMTAEVVTEEFMASWPF